MSYRNYNITVNNSKFDHGSSVVSEKSSSRTRDDLDQLLDEIRTLQKKMDQVEPLVSGALSELEKALRENNKPKISEKIKELSTGFAASILANIASPIVLSFLGIGV